MTALLICAFVAFVVHLLAASYKLLLTGVEPGVHH